jgi:hypothetical protein
MQSYSINEFIKQQPVQYCSGGVATEDATPYMAYNNFYMKYNIPYGGLCSYGICNELVDGKRCTYCCKLGSAYCEGHIKIRVSVCKYKLNGTIPCTNWASTKGGFCEIHK